MKILRMRNFENKKLLLLKVQVLKISSTVTNTFAENIFKLKRINFCLRMSDMLHVVTIDFFISTGNTELHLFKGFFSQN